MPGIVRLPMPTAPTRILVADEQPLVIWALERTLVAPGIEMVSAGSRDEVCDRLAGERFDVIVMSCELAESDMSDVIVEIDRLQPDVRLIVLCRSDSAPKLRARLARGEVYEMPFNIDRLVSAITGPTTDAPRMSA